MHPYHLNVQINSRCNISTAYLRTKSLFISQNIVDIERCNHFLHLCFFSISASNFTGQCDAANDNFCVFLAWPNMAALIGSSIHFVLNDDCCFGLENVSSFQLC